MEIPLSQANIISEINRFSNRMLGKRQRAVTKNHPMKRFKQSQITAPRYRQLSYKSGPTYDYIKGDSSNFTSALGVDTPTTFTQNLTTLLGTELANFVGIYTDYRIKKIEYDFIPFSLIQTTACILATYKDWSDSTAPVNLAAALDSQTVKVTNACEHQHRSIIPSLNSADVSGNPIAVGNQWVPIANPNATWFGLKAVLSGAGFAQSSSMFVYQKVHVEFKNSK